MTFPCGWSNSKGPEGQQIVVWNHERDQQQILSFLRTYRTHNPAPAGDAFFAEFRIQNRDHRLTFHLQWLFYSIFFPLATCVCVCVCSGAHREINILQNNNDILCPVRNCSGGTDRNRTDGRRQYGCSRRHYNCYKWYFYPVLFFSCISFRSPANGTVVQCQPMCQRWNLLDHGGIVLLRLPTRIHRQDVWR